MANSAAGSDFWKRISPSGSQASGEIGRRTWMTGSNIRVQRRRHARAGSRAACRCAMPSRKPLRHAHQAVVGQQRRCPGPSRRASSNGSQDVELALLPGPQRRRQVGHRRGSTRPPARRAPARCRRAAEQDMSTIAFHHRHPPHAQAVDGKRLRVLLGIRGVERRRRTASPSAASSTFGVDAHLLHRLEIDVRPHAPASTTPA